MSFLSLSETWARCTKHSQLSQLKTSAAFRQHAYPGRREELTNAWIWLFSDSVDLLNQEMG